jgi:hypothetical protein
MLIVPIRAIGCPGRDDAVRADAHLKLAVQFNRIDGRAAVAVRGGDVRSMPQEHVEHVKGAGGAVQRRGVAGTIDVDSTPCIRIGSISQQQLDQIREHRSPHEHATKPNCLRFLQSR